MKITFLAFTILLVTIAKAQTDSLVSGIYNLDSIKAKKGKAASIKPVLDGSTFDLATLRIHSSTLPPGKVNHPPRALNDREELIVVKEGKLKVTINDSSKILEEGGIAMIIAGELQSFENVSDKPVTYIVLGFKSKLPVDITRGKRGGGSLMRKWNEMTVKKTNKGESRPIFDHPSSMFERFETHITTLNAGFESHPPHTHRAEEIMLLMKGNVTVSIDEKNYQATAGDIILVTPNVPHNIKNTGNKSCWYYAIKWFNTAGK